MEIDLYRDDGIVHVIITGASHVEKRALDLHLLRRLPLRRPALAGLLRPRRGLPSDFNNNVKGRSARRPGSAPTRAWASSPTCRHRHLGGLHPRPATDHSGKAVVDADGKVLKTVDMPATACRTTSSSASDIDGNDVWVGTSKGLGWAIGEGYYPGCDAAANAPTGRPRRNRCRAARKVKTSECKTYDARYEPALTLVVALAWRVALLQAGRRGRRRPSTPAESPSDDPKLVKS